MPLVFTLLTLNALQYIQYDKYVQSMTATRKELLVDGPHFIVGLLTIMKQYHPSNLKNYLMYLANYFNNTVHAAQF